MGRKDIPITLPDGTKITLVCNQPPKKKKGAKDCVLEDMPICGGKTPNCKRCAGLLKKAKQDKKVADLLAKLKDPKHKCPPVEIDCACCAPHCPEAMMFPELMPVLLIIRICDTETNVKGALIHELTHAWQVCADYPDKTCKDCVKLEVEAFHAEGFSCKESLIHGVNGCCNMGRCPDPSIFTDQFAAEMIQHCENPVYTPSPPDIDL